MRAIIGYLLIIALFAGSLVYFQEICLFIHDYGPLLYNFGRIIGLVALIILAVCLVYIHVMRINGIELAESATNKRLDFSEFTSHLASHVKANLTNGILLFLVFILLSIALVVFERLLI